MIVLLPTINYQLSTAAAAAAAAATATANAAANDDNTGLILQLLRPLHLLILRVILTLGR